MVSRRVAAAGVLGAVQILWIGLASFASPAGTSPKAEVPQLTQSVPADELCSPQLARLLDDVLRASGLDDNQERSQAKTEFSKSLAMLKKHVGRSGSAYRKGRRLHDALHRFVFRQYSPLADSIDTVLETGQYNCVSATLFYGIMGRALGLDLRAVETPHHIYLQLHDRDRTVDIETTSRLGYDFSGDLERFRRFTWAYEFASHDEIESSPYYRFERVQEVRSAPVPLEQATAFLWHNSAQKALAKGDAVRAASYFSEEFKAYPQLAQRLDGFATSLAKAFRIEYEAGRFSSALSIARTEMSAFPTRTSSRDRMLAAATKNIQSACESGDPVFAEKILQDSEKILTIPSDRRILDTQACPHIIAAAVRAGDWDQAWRMVSRYQDAEPDQVEGNRLRAWVLSRQDIMQRESEEEMCRDPLDEPEGRAGPAARPVHAASWGSPSPAADHPPDRN